MCATPYSRQPTLQYWISPTPTCHIVIKFKDLAEADTRNYASTTGWLASWHGKLGTSLQSSRQEQRTQTNFVGLGELQIVYHGDRSQQYSEIRHNPRDNVDPIKHLKVSTSLRDTRGPIRSNGRADKGISKYTRYPPGTDYAPQEKHESAEGDCYEDSLKLDEDRELR